MAETRVFSVCNVKQFGFLACFIGMSWQAEPRDSQMKALSFKLKER